ncbi:MAG: hypothetical protein RJA20_1687 [Bacteroidota bacterium]
MEKPDAMINIKLPLYSLLLSVLCLNSIAGQQNRYSTSNTIGWYNSFATFQLTDRLGLHAEYQWRRNHLITDWQQSLLRVGLNIQMNPRVLARFGYAWIETYPYGEIPLNSMGRDFTEHRIYEMLQLSHKENRVDISHRFMLEQRFVGKYSSPGLVGEDQFPMLNRMRYMARFRFQPGGSFPEKLYGVLYDEIFIGFGKNVGANIFDQNRLGLMIGFQAGKNLRLEGGYLSQIVQYGRIIDGKNVFQYNSGLIINALFQVDLRKNNFPDRER